MSVHSGPDASRASASDVTEHANAACTDEQDRNPRALVPVPIGKIVTHINQALQLLRLIPCVESSSWWLAEDVTLLLRATERNLASAVQLAEPSLALELEEMHAHAPRDPAQLELVR